MKELKCKHSLSNKALRIAAQPFINNGTLRQVAADLGVKYNITGQTVVNYVHGMGKDGHLTDCLVTEFKDKLKNKS